MLVAPPRQPRSGDLELLIREARARRRTRWVVSVALVALVAGATLGIDSVVNVGSHRTGQPGAGPASAVRSGQSCGVRGVGVRILDRSGRTLYREPGHYVHPNAGFPTIRCSGSTIWAVWFNGAGMSQEAYLGARSLDGGKTWKLVFTEGMFGPKAPHELDAYLGPWTVRGRDAYFIGQCPACDPQPTMSLWVTKDGGHAFRRYDVHALDTWWPTAIRVKGDAVTIFAHRGSRRKSATVRVS